MNNRKRKISSFIFHLTSFIIALLPAFPAVKAAESYTFKGGSFAKESKIFSETPVAPRSFLKLVYRWEEVQKANASAAAPYLVALDGDGKALQKFPLSYRERAFDADNAAIFNHQFFAAMPGHPDFKKAQIKLPAKTAKIAMGVLFSGNAQTIRPVEFSAKALGRYKQPAHHNMPELPPVKPLSDAELDAKLAARKRLSAKAVTVGDTVTLQIDGKIVHPMIYKSTPYNKPIRYYAVNEYEKHGFNIFVFPLSLTPGHLNDEKAWRDDGTLDFDNIRQQLRKYLKYNPDAVYFLEINICPPRGWALKHPDEIYRFEDGGFGLIQGPRVRVKGKTVEDCPALCNSQASYASELYISDSVRMLENLFTELEKMPETKGAIGVYINGGTDQQWLDVWNNKLSGESQADYSPAAKRGFQKYLQNKYGNIDKLNAEWKSGYKSFDMIPVPSAQILWNKKKQFHSVGNASLATDYKEFFGWCGGRRAAAFAKAVKKATKERILTGSYSPQGGMEGYPLISQQCLKYILETPEWDFFAVVPNYRREVSDHITTGCFAASLRAHNKLYISELDLRTGEVQNWGYWGSDHWNETHKAANFDYDVKRYVLDVLARGGGYHAYDMNGGWFNTPNAKATWKAAGDLALASHPMKLTSDRIAVIIGENYWDFQSYGYKRLSAYLFREFPQAALARSGVPHDFYLLDDILRHPEIELPKVVIVGDASTATGEEVRELQKRLENSKRVVVWIWHPGFFSKESKTVCPWLAFNKKANNRKPWSNGKNNDPLMKNNGGFQVSFLPFYGIEYPDAEEVKLENGKTLYTYQGTRIPAAQVQRNAGFTRVALAVPGSLTPQFCRNLAREAGFAPLFESDELFSYGGGYFAMASLSDGVKTITLPAEVKVKKVVSNHKAEISGSKLKVTLKRGDLFIVQIE